MIKEKMLLENEINLIHDSLRGAWYEPTMELGVEGQQLVRDVEDSIVLDKLDVKWEVDGKKLIEKLKELSKEECFEIIEGAYTFWGRDITEIRELKNKRDVYKIPVNKITNPDTSLKQFPVEAGHDDSKYKTGQMILTLNRLYQNEKERLKGLFTLSEANLLIRTFNGFMYTPWNDDKEVLLRMVESGIMHEDYDDIYGVDKNNLFEKLNNLNSFQGFTVMRLTFEFWERKKGNPFGEELLKEIFGIA